MGSESEKRLLTERQIVLSLLRQRAFEFKNHDFFREPACERAENNFFQWLKNTVGNIEIASAKILFSISPLRKYHSRHYPINGLVIQKDEEYEATTFLTLTGQASGIIVKRSRHGNFYPLRPLIPEGLLDMGPVVVSPDYSIDALIRLIYKKHGLPVDVDYFTRNTGFIQSAIRPQ